MSQVRKIAAGGVWSTFAASQYKNAVLKPALKAFRERPPELPTFWTMPHDPICREILLNGFYEREILRGMCALAPDKSGTVLDVGANMGNHTIYFSREFARVISFEPVPRNCWLLQANLHLNDIRNVTLIQKGLSSERGTLHFRTIATNTNSAVADASRGDADHDVSAEIVPGDEALADRSDRIVLIKVDVEGDEPKVLQGLAKTITTHRPLIFFEALSAPACDESKRVLEELGYRNFYLLTIYRYENRRLSKLVNALTGRPAYLKRLEDCATFDGMCVASSEPLM